MESDFSINLMTYRSDVDAWARRSRMTEERVGQWLLSVAGSALLAYGTYWATRRSWRSAWSLASGVGLIGYAAAEFMKANNGRGWRQKSEHGPADVVTLESVDSFPASDAPSSNATTTVPRPLDGRYPR